MDANRTGMEPGMKPRKLKLSSGTWRFLIDSHRTTLWSPSGKRCRIANEKILKVSHACNEHEYPEPCRGPIGSVTPGKLRAFIEGGGSC
jgi:hypothetical protein